MTEQDEAIQKEAFRREHVANYMKGANAEGDLWNEALKGFEEKKDLLLKLKPNERMDLMDSLIRQWLPREERIVQPARPRLLQIFTGENNQISTSEMDTRNDVKGSVEEFLMKPSIEAVIPLLQRLNVDLTHSEQLEEFTRRLGTVTFHLEL